MIGIDLCVIERMEKHVHNRHFHRKIMTDRETQRFLRRPTAENLAGIFAAKEAASKALGTGIGKIAWRDIELSSSPLGQPKATITDRTNGIIHRVAISITHDGAFAAASAMLMGSSPPVVPEERIAMAKRLPDRPREAHKGSMGRAVLIGGSGGMSGSMWLSSMAAMRTGAGLVYSVTSEDTYPALSQKLIEPICLPYIMKDVQPLLELTARADAIGIGPGMGTGELAAKTLEVLLKTEGCPMVIDADGLNLLARHPEWLHETPREVILTPHRGELRRLLKVEPDDVKTVSFARECGMILIEKGAPTRIITPRDVHVNTTGNPGMATGGSGDVLTGIVTALVAMGADVDGAAIAGVYVHGLAGDFAARDLGEDGMIASDIVSQIPNAMKYLREAKDDELREYLGGDRSGSDRKEL